MLVLRRALPALVVLLAALLGLRRFDNTDTWWHLAGGRWIVEHGHVPYLDPLSWTVPDHPWINVQWLFDVFIYALHAVGGPSLLVVVSALCYAAATALLVINLRPHAGPVVAAVLAAWATIVSQERFAIRPEMISFLLLQVMLWLYGTGRVPGRRRLWLLPAVLALWANCHSLFIVGVVIVACQMVGAIVTDLPLLPAGWRRPIDPAVRRQVLVTGVVTVLATVVNPFGFEGAAFPIVLMSRINGDHPVFQVIGELKRPFSGYFVTYSITAYQLLFFVAVATVTAALVVAAVRGAPARGAKGSGRAQRRRSGAPAPERLTEPAVSLPPIDLADVAVFVGLAYLSLLARRNMALFAMGGAPAFAAALALLITDLPDALRRGARMAEQGVAAALLLALATAGSAVASNRFYHWNDEMHEFGTGVFDVRFPIRAAAFMRDQRLPVPMFNDFTTGGYLAWDRPLDTGVYIDGRTEVYDVDFIGPYLKQLANPALWQEEMDRRGVQTAILFHWWPNHQAMARHLVRDARWAVVYYDETSIVAVRRTNNDGVIARAQAAFPAARNVTEAMLLDDVRTWQVRVGRITGLDTYAAILPLMGRGADAGRFLARAAELRGRH